MTALLEPPLPALHPHMAESCRQKATALAAGLEHDEQRGATGVVVSEKTRHGLTSCWPGLTGSGSRAA